MSTMPVCTATIHAALVADDGAWSRLPYVGVQLIEPGEHIELRNCSCCHSTLGRAPSGELAAICARYDRACATDDVYAKYVCKRAMSGDAREIQEWRYMVADEACLARGGARW